MLNKEASNERAVIFEPLRVNHGDSQEDRCNCGDQAEFTPGKCFEH
jgi:hypothetical protein